MRDPLGVFVEAKQKQTECIGKGDSKAINGHVQRYTAAARQLLAGGEASIGQFATLLEHEDVNVRASAAAWLLKHRTEQAVAVLKTIAKTGGLAAMVAICTLARYAKGDLEIKESERVNERSAADAGIAPCFHSGHHLSGTADSER